MIYLDNNATTRVFKDVEQVVLSTLKYCYGNPSSSYSLGKKSLDIIENSRKSVASFLGCKPSEIIFTSCGSESNVTAIRGLLKGSGFKRFITTSVEHPSIKNLIPQLKKEGVKITIIGLEKNGIPKMDIFNKEIKRGRSVVSIMMAHNETGIIFPVEEMLRKSKEYDCFFHTDAVQAAGKIPINLRKLGVDALSISGHKFHAPKGIGALFLKDKTPFTSLITGGGQENGMRGGTSPTHQIAGIGKASEVAKRELRNETVRVKRYRDKMEKILLENYPEIKIYGLDLNRLPNTTFISFPGINGRNLMKHLDKHGITVSTGSACHSVSCSIPDVLQEMRVDKHLAGGTLRISLSSFTQWNEIESLLCVLPESIRKINR